MRRVITLLAVAGAVTTLAQPPGPDDPAPESLAGFQAAAARVLQETRVPGAGLALVRQSGVEWAGGVGLADRDSGIPVTADTHFRVGSISKSFIALALVQLSEDGVLDLDAPVREVVPEVTIDNPWEATDPVRILNLLEHTAGFDDMHFNEIYLPPGEPERPLEEVLERNPGSRRVRWRPGTRMSYSNPGYAVAGLVIETVAGMPYEDYIEEQIFEPLGMTSSSFRLTAADAAGLAQGYGGPSGPPVGFRPIYLRPAGNLHTSPAELARFVQMLLGWGELGSAAVVDPEYLGNMEQPRTTLATAAGLRNGYGSGIATRLDLPYKVLGHDGGIAGFRSSYGYSPSRDVGYVVLLNSDGPGSDEAMRRLRGLAIRYLKRGVEPPVPPTATVAPETLQRYAGYYHDANPRNQVAWPLQWLLAGRMITPANGGLQDDPVFGAPARLVPVTASTFRLDTEIDASLVFTEDPEGTPVLTGPRVHAERRPRWRIELVRVPVLAAVPIVASVFIAAIVWVARLRRARPKTFWELKLALLLCPLALLAPAAGLALTPMTAWGVRNAGTVAVFVGTLAVPTLALAISVLTIVAIREGASRALATYAGVIALAMGVLSVYLSSHDVLGLRLWAY